MELDARVGVDLHIKRGKRRIPMAIARTTEISSTSTKGFEDAINEGVTRAAKTVRNMKGAWVKEQEVVIDNDRVTEYKVHMLVTFVLDN